MVRVFLFLVVVTALALALAQFADRPGSVSVTWLDYQIETSVFVAVLALAALFAVAAFLWSLLRYLLTRPAALSRYVHHRQEERGLEALSQGLISVGAGDRDQAARFAALARRRLPNEPLTALLRAQSAQLSGDRAEARRIFEAMAKQPRTELLGLRGLFLEARREEQHEAARQFAEKAMQRNPDLAWSVNALFQLQCRAGDWAGALRTLDVARRQKHIDRTLADRRRAVLLTAQALEAEDGDIDRARELALEANKLAPGLVPAAELAGRLLVNQGRIARAGRIISRAWELSPHPDLARAYAYLRPGDSPRDRLKRVTTLAQAMPESAEGAVAVAAAAIEARAWREAREALAPLAANRPTARVCSLMARIEGGEAGDQGRVREWLARAVRAPRDPAWTADGFTSDRWAPVSPISGDLDAFEWKVPVESIAPAEMRAAPEEAVAAAPVPVPAGRAREEREAGEIEDAALRPDPGAPGGAGRDEALVVEAVPAPEPLSRATVELARESPAAAADGGAKKAAEEPAGQGDVTVTFVGEEAARATAQPAKDETPRPPAKSEAELFVSPRPPDDPGPDAPGVDDEARLEEPQPAEKA